MSGLVATVSEQRRVLGSAIDGVGDIVSDLGSDIGGVLSSAGSVATSALGQILSISSSAPTVSQTSTTSTSTSTSSPSSTASVPSASSIASTTSSVSSASTTSTASTSSVSSATTSSTSSTSVTTSPPITSAADTAPTTSSQSTVTTFVSAVGAAESTSSTAATKSTGFLSNKPLAGAVLGLAGLVGLVLIIVLATWFVRRRQHKRLMNDAISFDPTTVDRYNDEMEGGMSEKRRSLASLGSSSGGHGYNGGSGYGQYAPAPPQQGGHYGQNYSPQGFTTYTLPSQQMANNRAYGGVANDGDITLQSDGPGVVRKFSNIARVPVPAHLSQNSYGSGTGGNSTLYNPYDPRVT